jgi:predicted secreted protein
MSRKGPRAGIECKLYYQTAVAATFSVTTPTLVTEVQDLNITLNKTKIDITSRASLYKAAISGTIEVALNFSLLYNADPDDAIFTAMRTAFLNKTVWHWAIMDNLIATPGPAGSQGLTLPGEIMEFPIDQPLEGNMKIDVAVALSRIRVGSPAALVDPAWLIVAPSV